VGILKRSMMTVAAIGVAGTIAAGGSVPVLAATTSGVRYAVTQSVGTLGPNGTECSADLLSAAASDGNPAYMSAMVMNTLTETCTGWLESSVNGGAWTDVSPQQNVPGGQGINNPAWYKTANYYAGPGTGIRACVEVQIPAGGATPICGKSASLAESTAQPASDATPVYYAQHHQPANIGSGGNQCSAYLSSSTTSKASTSQVNLTFFEQGAVLACTGWLESSTDNGNTWEQATPTYSSTNTSWQQYAFSSAIADGTGELARACVQDSAATACTPAW
jgi:hypothetical protein